MKLTKIIGKERFGGIVGMGLGVTDEGEIGTFNIDMLDLIGSVVDAIKFNDFSIYIDKRNDYFYLRNIGYGGSGSIDVLHFDLGNNWTTGPTYFGEGNGYDFSALYDASYASTGGVSGLVIGGWDLGEALKGVIKPYTPVYLDNAYRRLKLRLNKTSTNLLEIGIDQFTQVAGVDENPDPDSWTPQSLRAFLRDYTLHLSLSSILVIDISGAINSILGAIINAILNAAFRSWRNYR